MSEWLSENIYIYYGDKEISFHIFIKDKLTLASSLISFVHNLVKGQQRQPNQNENYILHTCLNFNFAILACFKRNKRYVTNLFLF